MELILADVPAVEVLCKGYNVPNTLVPEQELVWMTWAPRRLSILFVLYEGVIKVPPSLIVARLFLLKLLIHRLYVLCL